MREDYKKAAKAEEVMNFVYDRFKTLQSEQVEKGNCDGIRTYNYILEGIDYAKLCIRCRRTGYAFLASAFIAWAINMLVLVMNLLKL